MEVERIKSESDYRRVLKQIEGLMDAKADTEAGDRLDVLATLAEAWERAHHAVAPPDPIAAIHFAMEQRGLSRRDLEPYIGSRARVAEVLNRKRSLTLPMIRKLHRALAIPADVLIEEPGGGGAARRRPSSPLSRAARPRAYLSKQ